ncbi:MAG: 8-amino-7-oxononanoate synthase [Kistimonas sp.]|nr:8-amino-7-oxononanoate synthase [Kistimonas sp.]
MIQNAPPATGFNLEGQIDASKAADLYRHRRTLVPGQGAWATVDGVEKLIFCSNDYLGLARHPSVIASFKKAADCYGVGSGASHLVTGHSRAHQQLEEELAAFTGRPRALVFSSGYMANIGVIDALVGPGDCSFHDRLNHASLLDAGRLSGARLMRYRHCDADDLACKLARSQSRRKLVVTDGVFSMDGDIAPLRTLMRPVQQQGAWLMVDDAHGFGTLGLQGGGAASIFRMSAQEVPVLIGTLGKAFGTSGAFVTGSHALVESLIQSANTYKYTTALPPALAEATRTSLRLVQTENWRRERLQHLIQRFRAGCRQLGLRLLDSQTPIQPIIAGSASRALAMSAALEARGILVTAIRPPTVPQGSSRLRVTFSANHQEEEVDRLLDALDSVQKTLGGDEPCP